MNYACVSIGAFVVVIVILALRIKKLEAWISDLESQTKLIWDNLDYLKETKHNSPPKNP